MNIKQPVSSIMSKEVFTINVSESLFSAKEKFGKFGIRHLPVLEDKKLVGMLSLTDILRLSFGDTYGVDEAGIDNVMYDMLTIEQVMKTKLISVKPEQSIHDVAEIFATKEFHALPVVDKGLLIGIVTTTDVIRFLLDSTK